MDLAEYTLVMSTAGHDAGEIFIIIKEDGEYVYLVDGRGRTLDRTKKKKKKHVAVLPGTEAYVPWRERNGSFAVTDEEIKHAIRCFKREEEVVRR